MFDQYYNIKIAYKTITVIDVLETARKKFITILTVALIRRLLFLFFIYFIK